MEYLISRGYPVGIWCALLLSALAVKGAEGAVPGGHHGCRYTSIPDAGHLHPSFHCGELPCAKQETAQLSTKLCNCFSMSTLRVFCPILYCTLLYCMNVRYCTVLSILYTVVFEYIHIFDCLFEL